MDAVFGLKMYKRVLFVTKVSQIANWDKKGHFGHSQNVKMAIFVPMYQNLGPLATVPKI